MSLRTFVTAIQVFVLRIELRILRWCRRALDRGPAAPSRTQAGQATAEYALVLLGAAAVALLLLAWATKSGEIEKLLNAVFDALVSKVR